MLRNELKFQPTNISGNIAKIKDNKIHNFSITCLSRKGKLSMQEPIETIIVGAQINIEDDKILNTLKKIQKCHL